MKSLRETVEIYKGRKAPEVFDEPQPDTKPYLQIEDLRPDATPKFARDPEGTIANKDDVIIAWDGANAGTVSFGLEGYIGSTLAILRPTEKDVFTPFLGYFLRSKFNYIRENTTGATIPHVSRDALENLAFEFPPLPEQRRIAARLDKADRLRRTRRYAQQLSDTFLQAVFVRMFGDALKPSYPSTQLGDLVKIKGGGTPSREVKKYYTGKIPWLTSKDMRGEYIFDTQEHITEEAIKESATNLVPVDSILVVVKSKILMRRVPLAVAKVPLCHGQDIKSIQCSEKIDTLFAMYVLKFNELKLLRQARGANTEGLTLPMLQEIKVPSVPLALQQKFAHVAQQFDHLRAQQREAQRQAEHLFQTLLQRAFEGGL